MMNINGFNEIKASSHLQQETNANGKDVTKGVLAVLSKTAQATYQ